MQPSNDLPPDVLTTIPTTLPVPEDDGACAHLTGLPLPFITLPSTSGKSINLHDLEGWTVIYCYPMTGRPKRAVPHGWVDIPGAAGCTPQACSFRDNYSHLKSLGAAVFGLSTQTTEDQIEAVTRLRLPYDLLSDRQLSFAQAINLPTFDVAGSRLIKRLTLIIKRGVILKYFYPVFPPDKNAEEVLGWLQAHAV